MLAGTASNVFHRMSAADHIWEDLSDPSEKIRNQSCLGHSGLLLPPHFLLPPHSWKIETKIFQTRFLQIIGLIFQLMTEWISVILWQRTPLKSEIFIENLFCNNIAIWKLSFLGEVVKKLIFYSKGWPTQPREYESENILKTKPGFSGSCLQAEASPGNRNVMQYLPTSHAPVAELY